MTTLRLPGLIDAHVHLREPGYTYKEDFLTGTGAALAGGVTAVLDMPNTDPPTSTPARLAQKAALAQQKAVCDVGLFVGATVTEQDAYLPAAQGACGLKIYVSETFGSLRIEELGLMHRLFRSWAQRAQELGGWRGQAGSQETTDNRPQTTTLTDSSLTDGSGTDSSGGPSAPLLGPIAVHAEELMLPVCLNLSQLYDVPLHIVHVSRRSEIELIRRAKEKGLPVTCEATPHHLLLTEEAFRRGGNRFDMRPKLATADDVAALWENLAVIDIFATDHAPHSRAEKGIDGPLAEGTPAPPGVPGVESMLPLLLTEVDAGRLELDDLLLRCVENPRRIYGLPPQPDTWVEVDVDVAWTPRDEDVRSRCGWTPFAGRQVRGRVERVVLRGQTVFDGARVLAAPGSGRVLFQESGSASSGKGTDE